MANLFDMRKPAASQMIDMDAGPPPSPWAPVGAPAIPGQPGAPQFNPNNPQLPPNPSWNPIYSDAMNMGPGVGQQLSGMQGMNQFSQEAMRKGPSAWAGLATQQQATEAQNARSRGAAEVAGQGATARSNLAMHGGLGGGAEERIAKSTGNNFMDMSQRVGQEQARNDMQIGMNDEQNRMQQLGMLPGMEMDKVKLQGQANQFDTTNAMANNQSKNQFDIDRYHEQMAAWGAGKTADATRDAGKK